MDERPLLLTTAQAAQRLGLTRYQADAARRSGLLPHRAIGARPLIRFTEDDLTTYLARVQAQNTPGGLHLTPGSLARVRAAHKARTT